VPGMTLVWCRVHSVSADQFLKIWIAFDMTTDSEGHIVWKTGSQNCFSVTGRTFCKLSKNSVFSFKHQRIYSTVCVLCDVIYRVIQKEGNSLICLSWSNPRAYSDVTRDMWQLLRAKKILAVLLTVANGTLS